MPVLQILINMTAKRQRVSNLHFAQVAVKDITNIVESSKNFVYTVQRKKNSGETLFRKPGRGGHN